MHDILPFAALIYLMPAMPGFAKLEHAQAPWQTALITPEDPMTDIPDQMRALMLTARDRLELQTVATPRPGPGQVLVRLAASPINPSDLMTVKGEYGIGKAYPLVPGLEGSGIVVASGPGLMGRVLMGKRIACAGGQGGMWADYAVVPATSCVPLPAEVSLGSGAMSAVNPLTAIALVSLARKGGHRAAVSTAAGGQLGRMIRKRAREKGLEIINVVRRAEQVDAIRAEGAAYVLNETDPDFDADLAGLCKSLRCRFAFDAVGGSMTYRLAEALKAQSEILVYGALAQKAVSLHPGTLIFKEVTVRGFWLSKWLPRKSLPEVVWHARAATRALRGGFVVSEVARIVPMEEALAGLKAYEADMSAGKTLIRMGTQDLGVGPTA
ncbi:MAG: zinc-binding dehydrogenase [Roseicyclus sp.]